VEFLALLQCQVSMSSVSSSQDLAKSVLREIVIPLLEKEVNEGRNFGYVAQCTLRDPGRLVLNRRSRKYFGPGVCG